tara:strand:- start:498 stop:761 length:264 start_codon:yes stop_codon:yes gene_type:complete
MNRSFVSKTSSWGVGRTERFYRAPPSPRVSLKEYESTTPYWQYGDRNPIVKKASIRSIKIGFPILDFIVLKGFNSKDEFLSFSVLLI